MADNKDLKGKKIDLVKDLTLSLDKKITYHGNEYKLIDLLEVVHELFYLKKGSPITTIEITNKLNLPRADKFEDKVLTPHLIKKSLLNFLQPDRIYFYFPAALIFKPNKGEVVDLTEISSFNENLPEFSENIEINICEPPILLNNFLGFYSNKEQTEVLKILINLAKKSSSKMHQSNLTKVVRSRLVKAEDTENITRNFYKIGNLTLPFIKWFGTGKKGEEFTCSDIFCEYMDKPLETPKEIQSLIDKRIEEKRKSNYEAGKVFDNNPGYKLLRIRIKREKIIPEYRDRKLQLQLTFAPTDFYTSVATNQSIDEPLINSSEHKTLSLREKYFKNENLNDSAYLLDSKLANMFGIALATITADNKILLQKRSNYVFMSQTKITLTTAENMVRGIDIDKDGNPDIFYAAQRCLREEVGLNIAKSDIVFLGFGIRLDNMLPQALGMVKLKVNSDEITFANARDSWEGLNFMEDFSFQSLKKYFEEPDLVSATAKLTILLALINQYGFEGIESQARQVF